MEENLILQQWAYYYAVHHPEGSMLKLWTEQLWKQNFNLLQLGFETQVPGVPLKSNSATHYFELSLKIPSSRLREFNIRFPLTGKATNGAATSMEPGYSQIVVGQRWTARQFGRFSSVAADELALWNIQLTEEQIIQLYNKYI